ncbi:MAG: response regulator [Desulfonatronovibrio sp.]
MKKTKVLVVDDEKVFLNTLTERLLGRGFDVQGVTSGKDCLDIMSRQSFEVVVLDFKMPSLSGLEVLQEIKKNWPETQVIMLTGHASAEAGIKGIKLGAFDYLIKPSPVEELVRKIYQALEAKSVRFESQPE